MSSSKLAVSVILPTYNRQVTLRWALRSVLCQGFGDFEVWVIGDGCTDDSGGVVKAFGDSRLHWVNLPVNSGSQSVPNNEGLRRASGKYIAHLGHDDLWLPWHLSGLMARLEETEADFVHAAIALYGPEGLRGVAGAPSRGRAYSDGHLPPSGWLYRREVATDCGAWRLPESLGHPVDVDFARRVYQRRKRIAASAEISVLKYPSPWWRAYTRSADWPQERPCGLIERDPEELRRQVARDIAARLADEWEARPRWRDAGRLVYRCLRETMLGGASFHPLQRWLFQQRRRYGRRLRGL